MRTVEHYSGYHFAAFRILLGALLVFYFFPFLWHGEALFSSVSYVNDPSVNWTYGYLPTLFNYSNSPTAIRVAVSFGIVLAMLFALGIYRRTAAVLLWVLFASLFNRNNFIAHPGLPLLGWLLLASALVPLGEPLSLHRRRQGVEARDWYMPAEIFYGAWVVLAVGYTMSGVLKLASPSWLDGTAVYYVTRTAHSYQWWFADFLRDLPLPFWQVMTWSTLALEVLFLPLCVTRWGRLIAWLGMLGLHVGIAMFFDFIELSLSLFLVHFFTFDAKWLPARQSEEGVGQPIVFYDGVCGLCDRFVQFLLSEDRHGYFLMAPLQGESAREKLEAEITDDMQSIVLFKKDGVIETHSDAVLSIISSLGGLWWFARVFRVVPRFIRDAVYALVARNRYRVFGKYDACKLPAPETRGRFLE